MRNKRNLREEQGITLIALIITIIVLVILAAVAITTAYNTGIIQYAIKGTEDYAKQAINENKVMEETTDKMSSTISKIESIISSGENPPPETIKEAIEQHYEFKENKTYEEGSKSITIPAGYYFADQSKDTTIDYGSDSIPQIDEGIVITDKVDGDGKSIGNEFVWVPVENINDMVMCQTHPSAEIKFNKETQKFTCSSEAEDTEPTLAGKLYATSTENSFKADTPNKTYNADGGLREPAIVKGSNGADYDAKIENYGTILGLASAEKFKEELQAKFIEMAKSIGKYGGFYIGRYETGGLKAEASTPVVQKYNTEIGNVNWYWQYKNSKSIAKEETGAISSMLWGCQWDATMKWFISCEGETKDYVTNSNTKGNYKDNVVKYKTSASDDAEQETSNGIVALIPTGGSEQTKVKNIYDMAGNAYDLTIEAYNSYSRVSRGGSCSYPRF